MKIFGINWPFSAGAFSYPGLILTCFYVESGSACSWSNIDPVNLRRNPNHWLKVKGNG